MGVKETGYVNRPVAALYAAGSPMMKGWLGDARPTDCSWYMALIVKIMLGIMGRGHVHCNLHSIGHAHSLWSDGVSLSGIAPGQVNWRQILCSRSELDVASRAGTAHGELHRELTETHKWGVAHAQRTRG